MKPSIFPKHYESVGLSSYVAGFLMEKKKKLEQKTPQKLALFSLKMVLILSNFSLEDENVVFFTSCAQIKV